MLFLAGAPYPPREYSGTVQQKSGGMDPEIHASNAEAAFSSTTTCVSDLFSLVLEDGAEGVRRALWLIGRVCSPSCVEISSAELREEDTLVRWQKRT